LPFPWFFWQLFRADPVPATGVEWPVAQLVTSRKAARHAGTIEELDNSSNNQNPFRRMKYCGLLRIAELTQKRAKLDPALCKQAF
jgi:hypothetical protein